MLNNNVVNFEQLAPDCVNCQANVHLCCSQISKNQVVCIYAKKIRFLAYMHKSDFLMMLLICIQFEPGCEKTFHGFSTRSNTNWAIQPQKMARGLKFGFGK